MKILKILAVLALIYVAIVAGFETLIGTTQPSGGGTIVLTTFEANGTSHDRVVSRLDSGGKIYVAVNHWPRAWFNRALENPDVQAKIDGEVRNFRAVRVERAEHDRVERENPHTLGFRILTGFPPRYFVRLDPR